MRYLPVGLLLSLLLLVGGTFGCGGGGGLGPTGPGGPPNIALVGDSGSPALLDFLRAKGVTVEYFSGWPSCRAPAIDGDLVVWEDSRNGNDDIYARDFSTGTEFRVNQDTGTASQNFPAVSGNLVVWEDRRNGNGDIYAYDIATGTEFKVNQDVGTAHQFRPAVSGSLVVWHDYRNGGGNRDIYAYDVSTDTEFKVSLDPGTAHQTDAAVSGNLVVWRDERNGGANPDIYARDVTLATDFKVNLDVGTAAQFGPAVSGNLVVWTDRRNGDSDIYARDVTLATDFQVSQDPGTAQQTAPAVSGNLVVWADRRNGNDDIYGYDVAATTEFQVSMDPGTTNQTEPAISGSRVVWTDLRPAGKRDTDIYLRTLPAVGESNVSGPTKKKLATLTATAFSYDMILFGDSLPEDPQVLAIFDAADAAGVPMLGIGTEDTSRPLGYHLAMDGRFALSSASSAGGDGMHVDVTAAGQGHAIFAGINTVATLEFEDTNWDEGDEQTYEVNTASSFAPADWTVLATLGPTMSYPGEPAIAEFTTPNGTRVMLDGSANTYDYYEYWTPTRWDILYNQVIYLAGP